MASYDLHELFREEMSCFSGLAVAPAEILSKQTQPTTSLSREFGSAVFIANSRVGPTPKTKDPCEQ
jgi:hypothetical protein